MAVPRLIFSLLPLLPFLLNVVLLDVFYFNCSLFEVVGEAVSFEVEVNELSYFLHYFLWPSLVMSLIYLL